jgi:Na+/H+ antiporter NhaD/arsenite permease-like protein
MVKKTEINEKIKQKFKQRRFQVLTLISIFTIGYLGIAFEEKLKWDKAVPALLTGMLMWAYIAITGMPLEHGQSPNDAISHHFPDIGGILFFLIGAMIIVNALDERGSLGLIKSWIKTENQIILVWIVTLITFFLSAVLDNLTTTIVMIAILRQIIKKRGDLMAFAVLIIIAANAGGAWSPIGDVTTTMLWVENKITIGKLIMDVFPASIVQAIFIPLILTIFPSVLNKLTHGVVEIKEDTVHEEKHYPGQKIMLLVGILGLISVPIFKTITHLPPWMGMMLAVCVVLIVNQLLNKKSEKTHHILPHNLFQKVEWNAVLFFLGILIAVSAFQSVAVGETNALGYMAQGLQQTMSLPMLGTLIGVLSSGIDNAPLVAAAKGMFNFPTDHWFWHFIAYTAGTGGSILIIGSAAGVVAMSMLHIPFGWYMKKFSLLILLSYLIGAGVFLLQNL